MKHVGYQYEVQIRDEDQWFEILSSGHPDDEWDSSKSLEYKNCREVFAIESDAREVDPREALHIIESGNLPEEAFIAGDSITFRFSDG